MHASARSLLTACALSVLCACGMQAAKASEPTPVGSHLSEFGIPNSAVLCRTEEGALRSVVRLSNTSRRVPQEALQRILASYNCQFAAGVFTPLVLMGSLKIDGELIGIWHTQDASGFGFRWIPQTMILSGHY